MSKSTPSELFATLRSYAQKLSDGDRTPAEIANALNDWAHESAETVKSRIHEEVEAAVTKMGFVKREEFDALASQVKALEKSSPKKNAAKKSTVKKTVSKKAVK